MRKISVLVCSMLAICAQPAAAQILNQNSLQPNSNFFISGTGTSSLFRTMQQSTNEGNGHYHLLQAESASVGKLRWSIGTLGTENGTNAQGSDFFLFGYNNDGSYRNDYLAIMRADRRVGLSTGAPRGALHIANISSTNTYASLVFGVPNDPGNQVVPVGGNSGGYNIDFNTWRDAVPDQIGARIRAERINNYAINSALVQGMDLVFSTSSGWLADSLKERMRIKWNGQVAIGTNNPHDYKLAVGGTIGAQRVRVTMTGWSDFVFHPSYRLISLPELQEFIRTNGHLPGIPTEREVKANGVDVGEMNKLLLQKVEELTLYLIDMNKRMEQQQERIRQLEMKQE